MKTMLSMAIVLLSLSACKKDKDAPMPTTVVRESIGVQYDKNLGNKTVNWFSADKMSGLSMPQISQDNSLHGGILFGYYLNGTEYGLYSPETFPVVYGQENWIKKQSVTFRKSAMSQAEMQAIFQKDLTPADVINLWNKGVNPGKTITHPHEGEFYLFRTADQLITGVLAVTTISGTLETMFAEVWIAK
ncbi:MAG TPA: hypothetical protein VM488_12090 [Pseudobacter sp.]|nr:hypothetical protein [Pseudobacter sp.]